MQHSADPLGKTKKGTRDVMYNMINVTNTSVCHGASKVAQWYRICNAGDVAWNPGLGRSLGGGHSNLLQYSCLENPHGQRSLVGYTPWGCKESDMTEHTPTYTLYVAYESC